MNYFNIDITASIALFLSIIIGTFGLATIINWFNPRQLIDIIKSTHELKALDTKITHDVKKAGMLTKFFFRLTSRGAERYFP
jgi:hypothetical protein